MLPEEEGSGSTATMDDTGTVISEGQPSWRDSLPEDLRGDDSISHIKSVEELVKTNKSAQAALGHDRTRIPTESSTPEEWKEFYGKVGRPKESKDYNLAASEKVSEENRLPAEVISGYAEEAHRLGLNTKQASELLGWYEQTTVQGSDKMNQVIESGKLEAQNKLKSEWGEAYDQKIELARAASRAGGEDFVAALDESGAGNDPRVIKFLAEKVGAMMGEDRMVGVARTNMKLTPEQAGQKMAELRRDPDFMKQYTRGYEPGHKEAVEQMRKLYVASNASDITVGEDKTFSAGPA